MPRRRSHRETAQQGSGKDTMAAARGDMSSSRTLSSSTARVYTNNSRLAPGDPSLVYPGVAAERAPSLNWIEA
jgi:hypothetical protein